MRFNSDCESGVPEDASKADFDQEHAFIGQWKTVIQTQGRLTQDQLSVLVKHKRWSYAVAELINELCARDALDEQSVNYLRSNAEPSEFARDQLTAYALLLDAGKRWEERLGASLDLRANWATYKVIATIDEADKARAAEIISNARRPKGIKRRFLDALRAGKERQR